jgi:hypothetical protein
MTWGDEEIIVIPAKRILKNLESSKRLLTIKIKKAQANPEIISWNKISTDPLGANAKISGTSHPLDACPVKETSSKSRNLPVKYVLESGDVDACGREIKVKNLEKKTIEIDVRIKAFDLRCIILFGTPNDRPQVASTLIVVPLS